MAMANYVEAHTGARIYGTLEDALQDIALRSFYEDATITPLTSVGALLHAPNAVTPIAYMVTDDANVVDTDGWYWTPEDGVDDTYKVSEASRLHGEAEFYNSARHIQYNLPTSVEALEGGKAVSFAYAVVSTLDTDDVEDNIAGWILASVIHDD